MNMQFDYLINRREGEINGSLNENRHKTQAGVETGFTLSCNEYITDTCMSAFNNTKASIFVIQKH